MRIVPWIRAEIRDWLGVEEERLGIIEEGLTFNAPHPDKVEGRKALMALTKNPWAIGIGCTAFGVILGKLL